MNDSNVHQVMMVIIQEQDLEPALEALKALDVPALHMVSSGGFLRRRNATLLIGLDDARVDAAIEVIRANVVHNEGEDTQGTIFVLPVNNFVQV